MRFYTIAIYLLTLTLTIPVVLGTGMAGSEAAACLYYEKTDIWSDEITDTVSAQTKLYSGAEGGTEGLFATIKSIKNGISIFVKTLTYATVYIRKPLTCLGVGNTAANLFWILQLVITGTAIIQLLTGRNIRDGE